MPKPEPLLMRAYSVTGRWPFPLDMLRRDQAIAADAANAKLIERISSEASDPELGMGPVTVALKMVAGDVTRSFPEGRYYPAWERWESFGWKVDAGVAEVDLIRAMRATAGTPAPTIEPPYSLAIGDTREALRNVLNAYNYVMETGNLRDSEMNDSEAIATATGVLAKLDAITLWPPAPVETPEALGKRLIAEVVAEDAIDRAVRARATAAAKAWDFDPTVWFQCTLHIKVDDPAAFVAHSRARYIADGCGTGDDFDAGLYGQDADEDGDEFNMNYAVQMVFDPGESPPGCTIEESECPTQGSI